MSEWKPIKEGKVREIYDNGDSLIMVATDRISCFDVILKNIISKKGTVLTQMSKFWFDLTEDIVPNHMISADVKDMPEFFQQPAYDGNSMMCRKLTMLPIECIVRGYITGSGWEPYVASSFRKVYRNPTNCRNQFTHLPQKLKSVTTTRISLLSKALMYWKKNFLAKEKSMLKSFAIIPSLFIKNAQIMH